MIPDAMNRDAPFRRNVVAAAVGGVATAVLLVLVLNAAGGSGGDERVQASRSTSSSTTVPAGSGSSSIRPAGSDPTTTTPVTVGVPRADQEAAPDLAPPSQPLDTAPPPVEPITDPEEAATAYLIAAETVTSDDAGRRHRRAQGYVADENPESLSGVLVADAPPEGSSRIIEVVSVSEWARNDDRIAYQITYQPYLSPSIPASDERTTEGPERITYVVVAQEPEGHWLVTLHSAELDPVE
jgi:hypothetical protein